MRDILVAVLSSSAFSAIISFVLATITAQKKENSGIQSGVRILLYDRIKHLGKSYITRGWITVDELEDFHNMHSIYHHDLDGNGFLDAVVASVNTLPVREGQ